MPQFLNPFRWIYLITTPCSVNILFSCSSHATSKSTLTPIKLVKSLPWLDNPPRFELCIILGWSLDSNRPHRGCQSLNRSERPKAGNHYPAKRHEFHSLMAYKLVWKESTGCSVYKTSEWNGWCAETMHIWCHVGKAEMRLRLLRGFFYHFAK